MEFTIGTIAAGSLFKLGDKFYIKTNMIYTETKERYCCNLQTGRMDIYAEDTKVELLYISLPHDDAANIAVKSSSIPMTSKSLAEIANDLKDRREKIEA